MGGFLVFMMAYVYILYSKQGDVFYIGSTQDLEQRLEYHRIKEFTRSYTSKFNDWELYLSIPTPNNSIARKIEYHIKRMKSKIYINNLKKYPEMIEELIARYSG